MDPRKKKVISASMQQSAIIADKRIQEMLQGKTQEISEEEVEAFFNRYLDKTKPIAEARSEETQG